MSEKPLWMWLCRIPRSHVLCITWIVPTAGYLRLPESTKIDPVQLVLDPDHRTETRADSSLLDSIPGEVTEQMHIHW